MTLSLFDDWFQNYFVPETKEYCRRKGIQFKILLLLHSAPAHPRYISDVHPDVKVIYLPPSTTALIQPMDQDAIGAFKAHYLWRTFAQTLEALESGETLREFWKRYNILHAIQDMSAAWKNVPQNCMRGIWKQALKTSADAVEDFDKDSAIDRIVSDKTLRLGHALQLDKRKDEIRELINAEAEEISNEDLINLEEEQRKHGRKEQRTTPTVTSKFMAKKLAEAFAAISSGVRLPEEMDDDWERFAKADRQIQEALHRQEDFDKDSAIDRIVSDKTLRLGHALQLDKRKDEIRELINAEAEEISNEDLINLEEEQRKHGRKEQRTTPTVTSKFMAKKLAEAFAAISSGVRLPEEMDDDWERFAKADRQIQEALACYMEIYKGMKKVYKQCLVST
ncbi:hypothetical protein M514_21587 [Trichuris suis]|uniref:DDE-1 domain-containing protein n=1 Tax=Trichuris suis TaxID=68888 RepID=A0A085NA04_9BILA|nr:hypothetical protein M514_21587 [Trichuris suis]